jgi:RNA polymerase sigma-70 factor (ECF subfamily)
MIAATPDGGEGHHGSLGAERARGGPSGRRDRAAARRGSTTPWEAPSASPRALSVAVYPVTIDIESLYRKHGPMVSRRCQYLLGDRMAAMDTMQDVFVELLRRRECLDASAPVGLILTIARNLCLNRLRSRRRRSEHPDGEALLEIANQEDDSNPEDRALARRVLARLFHHHADSARRIAILYHVERMTLEEVAREVNMSISGVRRCLAALRIGQYPSGAESDRTRSSRFSIIEIEEPG